MSSGKKYCHIEKKNHESPLYTQTIQQSKQQREVGQIAVQWNEGKKKKTSFLPRTC